MKNISRRDFLKGSAATVAGAAALGLLGACSSNDAPAAATTEEKFDKECDFLIVGYGLAGEAAALEANDIDPNAKICILEKMEEAQAGGNSIASGQTVIVPAPDDLETFKKYLIACSQPNPIPEEYVDFMAKEFSDQRGWIQATVDKVGYELGYVGGGPLAWGSLVTEFPDLDGSSFKGCSAHVRKAGTTFEYGGVWRGFDLAVRDRGENIELMFSTAFTSLIQNLETKEVKGVVAKGADGKEIRIKANKGVLLACGGYENNLQMQRFPWDGRCLHRRDSGQHRRWHPRVDEHWREDLAHEESDAVGRLLAGHQGAGTRSDIHAQLLDGRQELDRGLRR